MIMMQTVYQFDAGVDHSAGEAVGAITGFTDIAIAAIGMIVLLLRHISDESVGRGDSHRAVSGQPHE